MPTLEIGADTYQRLANLGSRLGLPPEWYNMSIVNRTSWLNATQEARNGTL